MKQPRFVSLLLVAAALLLAGVAARAHVAPPEGDGILHWPVVLRLGIVLGNDDTTAAPNRLLRVVARGPAKIAQEAVSADGGAIATELVEMSLTGESSVGTPVKVIENPDLASRGAVVPGPEAEEPAASKFGLFLVLGIGDRVLHNSEPLIVGTRTNHWPPFLINYRTENLLSPDAAGPALLNGDGQQIGRIAFAQFGAPHGGDVKFEDVTGRITIKFRKRKNSDLAAVGQLTDTLNGGAKFLLNDVVGPPARFGVKFTGLELGGADQVASVHLVRRSRGLTRETKPTADAAAVAQLSAYLRITLSSGRILQTKRPVRLAALIKHAPGPILPVVLKKRGGPVPLVLVATPAAKDGGGDRRRVVAYLTEFGIELPGNMAGVAALDG